MAAENYPTRPIRLIVPVFRQAANDTTEPLETDIRRYNKFASLKYPRTF